MYSGFARKITSVSLAFVLFASMFLSPAASFAAGDAKSGKGKTVPQIVGLISVNGTVTVNDKSTTSGSSVFDNSNIKVACAKGNNAIVNLGRMGRIELNPGAHLVLRFSEGLITGDLLAGNIVVNAEAGVKVAISTSEGVAAADGKEPSVIPVRTQKGVRCVPMLATSSASSPAIGTGAIAAILIGIGGAAVAGAAIGVNTDRAASGVVP